MATGAAPLVIAVVGLLIWVMASNQKASEAGKIMFACGVLVLTMDLGSKQFHL